MNYKQNEKINQVKESTLVVGIDIGSTTPVSSTHLLVKARDLKGEKTTIVSVIGDGSLTGGMAYEALHNAAKLAVSYTHLDVYKRQG